MSAIQFEAKLLTINSWTLLRLPITASEQLPSRGMVMVEGSINAHPFQAPLEPDGKGSHWLKVDTTMLQGAKAGDTVNVSMEPVKLWPEPNVPDDLRSVLTNDPQVHSLWMDLTTQARWDWIRWISSTGNVDTRRKRIEVALSKLKAGDRRPCCFNRSICAEPAVSKNGILL